MDEDDAGRVPVASGSPVSSGSAMSERMQALLSRAAEEQLTEQRQVSMVLTDLRQLVTGLGDRLDALGRQVDARAAADAQVATSHGRGAEALAAGVSALGEDVTAVRAEVGQLASGADLTRTHDALASRLDHLEAAARRPVLALEQLRSELAPVLSRLTAVEAGGPVLDRLTGFDARLEGLEQRLGAVAERLADVGDAAGGVPSVAVDVARLVGRLDAMTGLPTELAALREDVGTVGAQVGAVSVPSAEAVAAAVTQQVTDRLVDELAPRVAELVLTRVAATLVEQVSGSVTAHVQDGLAERVRAETADSERRISAHVDEAVLALAEALLRRRRGTRAEVLAAVSPEGGLDADDASGADTRTDTHPGAGTAPSSGAGVVVRDVPAEAPGGAPVAEDAAPEGAHDAAPPIQAPPRQAPPGAMAFAPAPPPERGVTGPAGGPAAEWYDTDGSPRRPWWRAGG